MVQDNEPKQPEGQGQLGSQKQVGESHPRETAGCREPMRPNPTPAYLGLPLWNLHPTTLPPAALPRVPLLPWTHHTSVLARPWPPRCDTVTLPSSLPLRVASQALRSPPPHHPFAPSYGLSLRHCSGQPCPSEHLGLIIYKHPLLVSKILSILAPFAC